MKRSLLMSLLLILLLGSSGCATSSLKWSAAAPGDKSRSGKKVLWHLQGVNNGIYLFYYIPIVCGHTKRPNRWDYQFFLHWINEKHADRLLRSRLKQLRAADVEDVSVEFKSNGWCGLGIFWSRSFTAKGKAVGK